MTKYRIKRLQLDIKRIKIDFKTHDYTGALKGADNLTITGSGVPLAAPAYWHAKHLQHKLYYYGTWNHSLAGCLKRLRLISDELDRMRSAS